MLLYSGVRHRAQHALADTNKMKGTLESSVLRSEPGTRI